MNLKKIASNTFFLYFRLILTLCISLFSVRIILSALGDVSYGVYNVVAGFVTMFAFFNTTLINGTQRFYNFEIGNKGYEAIGVVYRSALHIQMYISLGMLLVIEAVGMWYLCNVMNIPSELFTQAIWLFQFATLSLFISMLQVPYSAALIAHEKLNYYAYFGIFDVVLKLVAAYVISTFHDFKLAAYGGFLFLISLGFLISYYVVCRKKFPYMFHCQKHDSSLTKSILSFMGWNTLGSSSYIFRNQGINLLFNSYFGVLLNAANGIACQISGALSHFATNLITAFKPQLVQSYAKQDIQNSLYMVALMTRISYALIFLLSVPIILDIDFILNIWLGSDNVPENTASLSVLVVVSILISCWHTPIVQLIHAVGKLRAFQIVTSIIILSIILFTWIAFSCGLGPNWAYYVTIILYVVNQIAAMTVLKRLVDYSIYEYLKAAVLPCLVYTVCLPIMPYIYRVCVTPGWIQLIVLCLITLICGMILGYYVILTKKEKDKFRNFIISRNAKKSNKKI